MTSHIALDNPVCGHTEPGGEEEGNKAEREKQKFKRLQSRKSMRKSKHERTTPKTLDDQFTKVSCAIIILLTSRCPAAHLQQKRDCILTLDHIGTIWELSLQIKMLKIVFLHVRED